MKKNAGKKAPRTDEVRSAEGYAPFSGAPLHIEVVEPPPIPTAGFSTDEDGLRMLAALGELTSLEPDYAHDVTAEASVTIVECADEDLVHAALTNDRWRSIPPMLAGRPAEDPQLLLNGYDSFLGLGDEAEIEIVEIVHAFESPDAAADPPAAVPASLSERLAAAARTRPASRFLKALSGDG